jgi:hypothetical protein
LSRGKGKSKNHFREKSVMGKKEKRFSTNEIGIGDVLFAKVTGRSYLKEGVVGTSKWKLQVKLGGYAPCLHVLHFVSHLDYILSTH